MSEFEFKWRACCKNSGLRQFMYLSKEFKNG